MPVPANFGVMALDYGNTRVIRVLCLYLRLQSKALGLLFSFSSRNNKIPTLFFNLFLKYYCHVLRLNYQRWEGQFI